MASHPRGCRVVHPAVARSLTTPATMSPTTTGPQKHMNLTVGQSISAWTLAAGVADPREWGFGTISGVGFLRRVAANSSAKRLHRAYFAETSRQLGLLGTPFDPALVLRIHRNAFTHATHAARLQLPSEAGIPFLQALCVETRIPYDDVVEEARTESAREARMEAFMRDRGHTS